MHSNELFFLWYKIEAIFNKLIYIVIYILQIEKKRLSFEYDFKII